MVYFGLLRADQGDVVKSLGSQLYDHWDRSRHAPEKKRPREPIEPPTLGALSFSDGKIGFPDALINKFAKTDPEYKVMLDLKAEVMDTARSSVPVAVERADPAQEQSLSRQGSQQALQSPSAPRAVGRPDWSIDGGAKPPSLDQVIDLEHVPAASFGESRPRGVSCFSPAFIVLLSFVLTHDASCDLLKSVSSLL